MAPLRRLCLNVFGSEFASGHLFKYNRSDAEFLLVLILMFNPPPPKVKNFKNLYRFPYLM